MKTLSSRIAKWTDTLLVLPWSYLTVFFLTTAGAAASIWFTANHNGVAAIYVRFYWREMYLAPTAFAAIVSLILGGCLTRQPASMAITYQGRMYLLQILSAATVFFTLDTEAYSTLFASAFAFGSIVSLRIALLFPRNTPGWSGVGFYLVIFWLIVFHENEHHLIDLSTEAIIFVGIGSFLVMAITAPIALLILAVKYFDSAPDPQVDQ